MQLTYVFSHCLANLVRKTWILLIVGVRKDLGSGAGKYTTSNAFAFASVGRKSSGLPFSTGFPTILNFANSFALLFVM